MNIVLICANIFGPAAQVGQANENLPITDRTQAVMNHPHKIIIIYALGEIC